MLLARTALIASMASLILTAVVAPSAGAAFLSADRAKRATACAAQLGQSRPRGHADWKSDI